MKKGLLGLMVISLIIASGLIYADNDFIIHDTVNGTITVYTGDFSYGITIQDKNLGASVVGTGQQSYGQYFQRGNNHGNSTGANAGTNNELLEADVNEWINKGYSGDNDKFIIFNNKNKGTYDYRSGVYYTNATNNSYVGDSAYNNLWGGGNDNQTGDATIVKGYDTVNHVATNLTGRQGPCREGYHVPSAGEWNELVKLRCGANSDICSGDVIQTPTGEYAWSNRLSSNGIGTVFYNDLLLPRAGGRHYVGNSRFSSWALYWSSSPRSGSKPEDVWTLYFISENVYPGGESLRAYGYPIRCFKNSYVCPEGYKNNETGCVINKDIVIQATATTDNQTLKINKYFANAYTVDWGDGTTGNLTADSEHTYSVASGYTITLSPSSSRWTFQNITKPLIPKNGTTMTGVKIIYMPSLADGFGNNATAPGNNFFRRFNNEGAITQLPEGSFDTSNIITIGTNYFYGFNYSGSLTSLPKGSFRLSTGLTVLGDSFFGEFNLNGQLRSLPEGSFDTSHITTVGDNFFRGFNYSGSLVNLSTGSFDISNIVAVGNYFFYCFNHYGQLTSLPEGSFRLSTGLTIVKHNFFRGFNQDGQLTNLPEGSFDTSHVTTVGDSFFETFNQAGQLIKLPNGSFKISTGLTVAGHNFFRAFNSRGQITSLPDGSFNTENITTVGNDFFRTFNNSGQITSLPTGSFDTSHVTTAGNYFFYSFNNNGKITYLPDSFTMNSTGAANTNGYQNAFNSPNYTINKNISDLVSGITVPLDDRNTFSDNQPGRCGVHENWLVTTADACSISYDDTLGGTGTFKYAADTTGVEIGSGITIPTREGYSFSGWQDTSGNKLDEVTFPDMDGETLYANWIVNQYTITFKDGENEITSITADYGTGITPPANPTKNGYKFVKWEPEIPATMPADDITINAVWERNGSSGGGGGGGGGGSSSSSSSTGSDTSNQQSGSGTNNSTGTQNHQTTTGTIANEPEGTGNNTEIQTGNQTDTPEQNSQDNNADTSNNTTEGQNNSQGSSTYSTEFQEAYEFAKGNGITTMPTIQKANMEGKLTRIAMAKMLSQYAINVLDKEPDTTQNVKFNDVTDKMDTDYDDGVTLAYQLGIMGQNMPGNNFRPNDEVTRAEFATALSRMLYATSDGIYKSTSEYYTNHMKKLKEEGIITKDDPNMKELRGYVMIMLMRSAK